jgi:DNA-binding CsgD family transcriptional regulator
MGSLLGRRRECAELDRLVADTLSGSRVLVLRGDAGVGKSALLEYLAGQVGGWRVLSASGVESEMELAHSGLHQLLAPLLDRLEGLPALQRGALEAVFGFRVGPAADRFLVGLAALTLLAGAAERQPLICIVDDAQWLDQASTHVLSFVARRLHAERIALVCAARSPAGDEFLADLPVLAITGLDDDDARRLLQGHLHSPIDPSVCDRIIAESRGNPLALLELPRTWSVADLAGGFGLPDVRPVADKIERSYVQRLLMLPPDTRLLLLIAAAEPLGDVDLLRRAADALGIDMRAAEAAATAELVQIHTHVEFAHPLVRSACYRAALDADRQRVHRALAEATDVDADPDRRAWHRARATVLADEDVAAELERSADRARGRGGLSASAAFLTRAAELTLDPGVRTDRAIEAAFAHARAGSFTTAREMASIAGEGPFSELRLARLELLHAQLAFASGRGREATPLLLAAAGRLEAIDDQLARETYLDAYAAALFGGHDGDAVSVRDVTEAARAAPTRGDGKATGLDLLLDALIALADDYETAVPLCRAALDHLLTTIAPNGPLRSLWLGTLIALELWEDEQAQVLSYRYLQTARATGALGELELALGTRTHVLVLFGELSAAELLLAEGDSVREVTGISGARYAALMAAAWRGGGDQARTLIETEVRDARARGQTVAAAGGEYAHAILSNSGGQYEDGRAASCSASEYSTLVVENCSLAELVESATRTTRIDLAIAALDRLATKAEASGTDWALGIEARSRALVNDGDRAEELFHLAIDHLSRTRVRAELARAHLLYGEWLRRAGRRVDARRQLATAHEMFVAMGLAGFADRTRRELLATGATVRKRIPETLTDLTPQETQIAVLARDGSSNSEIAAMLFVSPRTVEWHLRKVFTKLGISRRQQLRAASLDDRLAPASDERLRSGDPGERRSG